MDLKIIFLHFLELINEKTNKLSNKNLFDKFSILKNKKFKSNYSSSKTSNPNSF